MSSALATPEHLRVLIVGGYGTFGGRLVHLLKDEPHLTLLVAGRSLPKAAAFCSRLAGAAHLVPAHFDRDGDLHAQLATHRPLLVIDASGPFQVYGARPYRLAEACIAHGIDYLDLADGADFVHGIRTLDADATSHGTFALSGASTFPVLTAAAVRHLSTELAEVRGICAGISPSPHAGVGESVIRAIAGYAGAPIKVWRSGGPARAYAFLEQRRVTIAVPGRMPLRSIVFSLIDVPDLQVLPQLWPNLREVWTGAGPLPLALHRVLIAFAWLRRARLMPSLIHLAPLMSWAVRRLRWGEHRGGMFVTVEGTTREGTAISRSWHLLAEGNDGALIPSMAAESIVRKLLAGNRPPAGARSAASDLDLTDYTERFAGRTIYHDTRTAVVAEMPLYQRLLGSTWSELPQPLRAMHDVERAHTASGLAQVRRGTGLIARCIAALVGFPRAGDTVPVSVTFTSANGVERWTRNFAGRSFSSEQRAGRGREDALLCERFGPISIAMALVWSGQRLELLVRRVRLLFVPLPRWLTPVATAHEFVSEGCFHFDVALSHPLAGLIVHYRGWLKRGPAVPQLD